MLAARSRVRLASPLCEGALHAMRAVSSTWLKCLPCPATVCVGALSALLAARSRVCTRGASTLCVGPLWGELHLAALARSRDLLARVRVLREEGGGAPCYACGELTGSPHPSTMRGELVGGTLMRPPHPASVRGKRLASYERQTHASSWPRADKECGGAFALWRRHAYTSSLPGIGRSLCAILEARSWTP